MSKGMDVVKRDEFVALADPAAMVDMKEAVEANFPDGFGFGDLPAVRIPSGGGQTWELPDGEVAKKFRAVVVEFSEKTRRYYDPTDESQGRPPDCQSVDGITGLGTPGGACMTCEMNLFGSAGRRKACKQGVRLMLMAPKSLLPWRLTLPVTSRKAWAEFKRISTAAGLPYWKIIVEFGLREETNADNIKYSTVTLMTVGELQGDELDLVRQYRAAICGTGAIQAAETGELEVESSDEELN